LSPKAPSSVAAGIHPNQIALTPDGRTVYVTNYNGGGPSNGGGVGTISQYNVDQRTGALLPKTPATVATAPGPVGIAVSPEGKSAYVTGNIDNTVSQYDIDPVTGALSPKSPTTVAAGQGPREIAFAPDGNSA
jgi:DNA-binding beta-propeller fold protein YncE